MALYDEEDTTFGNRRIYLMILLYKTVGLNSELHIPQYALSHGALGSLMVYTLTLIFIGIPIMYMELIISQFTNRNCIDVWKIRPCLSHFGYMVFVWQIFLLIYNHVLTTLLLHYLLISFESPPPYRICGPWAAPECNILKRNYSLNQFCVREKLAMPMCENLYSTLPEYQYFTRKLLEENKYGFTVSKSIIMSSGVALLLVYFNVFNMVSSMKWSIYPMTVYPVLGTLVTMMGSLRQKGLVQNIARALDVQLDDFVVKLDLSRLVHQAVHSVGVGTGVYGTLASRAPFRSPCYANAVIAVVTCLIYTAITICITGMMVCPYALAYSTDPERVINFHISFGFVKIPKMISEYESAKFWLLLEYSTLCSTGISSSVVFLFSLLITMMDKSDKLKRYPAVVSFVSVLLIFLITLPVLGSIGKQVISVHFIRSAYLTTIFIAICENVVFIVTYGFGRFYEDIHFMQGIPPKTFMKVSWVLVIIVLGYMFFSEIINIMLSKKNKADLMGLYILMSFVGVAFLIFLVRLLVAGIEGSLKKEFELDPQWGPVNLTLRRSRAMFSAHAMTKEYMYRQYHLQAGVVERQQRSNVRATHQPLPEFIADESNLVIVDNVNRL